MGSGAGEGVARGECRGGVDGGVGACDGHGGDGEVGRDDWLGMVSVALLDHSQ